MTQLYEFLHMQKLRKVTASFGGLRWRIRNNTTRRHEKWHKSWKVPQPFPNSYNNKDDTDESQNEANGWSHQHIRDP